MVTRMKRVYAVRVWLVNVVETEILKKEASALCLEIGSRTMPMVISHTCPVRPTAASLFPPRVIPLASVLSLK